MPKVSDAYRQARRDEIVAATLTVIARRGLRALTMADIIEESGLSAGSVYSHFTNKDELIELVATKVIGERVDQLNAESTRPPLAPLEVVHWWLAELERDALPYGAALQIWGEAASDPGIRTIVLRRMSAIEDAFTAAVEHWLASSDGDASTARDTARAMLTLCQGYIVRTAVLGPQDLSASIARISLLSPAGHTATMPGAPTAD